MKSGRVTIQNSSINNLQEKPSRILKNNAAVRNKNLV